jgi:ATP-dependent Clp protease protease subunit
MDFSLEELLDLLRGGFTLEEYQYLNQLINHRTIIFNEEVSESIVEKVYLPLKEFENDSDTSPITLIINSIGGSVADGFFLAQYLTNYQKPLTILVCGYAASMSTVILAAGGKNDKITRKCYPCSYGLIHDGNITMAAGTEAKSASDVMAFNDKVDRDIRDFIIANTNITEELYDSKARHQWFLSAQEMLELNLIDEIIGTDVKSND